MPFIVDFFGGKSIGFSSVIGLLEKVDEYLEAQTMEEALGLLKVVVLQGKRLVIRDFKSSDPYVVVKLGNQVIFLATHYYYYRYIHIIDVLCPTYTHIFIIDTGILTLLFLILGQSGLSVLIW